MKTKRSLPKKLKIGGHIVKVRLVPLEDKCGEWDSYRNEININDAHPASQKSAALLHEIFHACNPTFGSEQLSHSLLDSLSEQLYQVLSDNNLITF